VTLVASLRPAIRATRVPPIAAVREGAEIPPGRFARYRTPASALLTLAGFAALVYGLFGPGLGTAAILLWMGLGTLLIFFGVALLSARFVPALAWAVGWPSTRFAGAAGTLARDNAQRNPQRTASTSAALMIGIALVTLVAILASGIIKSFEGAVNDLFTGDYAITAENNFSPIPIAAGDAAANAPGVTAVGNVRAGEALVFGSRVQLTGVNPDVADVIEMDWKQGSQNVVRTLGANGAFVDDGYASDHHLSVGDQIPVTTARGARLRLRLRGIFDPPTGGSPFGAVTISQATFDRSYDQPQNLFSIVRTRGGETDANRRAIEQALGSFPNAKVQTRSEFIDNQISGLSSLLNVLYVLLALSIVVSVFGIVNTLVLSVFERTREIGMLRAIGMTRRQVRRMIRQESVIVSLIGAVTGIALGIVLGGLLVSRVDFIVFSLPLGSLVTFAVASIVVGIVAAILPARRAAKLNPLEALSYE